MTDRSRSSRRRPGTLAVLYLHNEGGSKKDEYFRDGVTEDIIIEMSRLRGLSLLSVAAVRAFRDASVPALEAGRKLGAAYVLDGSLRRARGTVRPPR
jgi:TolB-like protein